MIRYLLDDDDLLIGSIEGSQCAIELNTPADSNYVDADKRYVLRRTKYCRESNTFKEEDERISYVVALDELTLRAKHKRRQKELEGVMYKGNVFQTDELSLSRMLLSFGHGEECVLWRAADNSEVTLSVLDQQHILQLVKKQIATAYLDYKSDIERLRGLSEMAVVGLYTADSTV